MFLGSAPPAPTLPEGLITKASISPTMSGGEVLVNVTVVNPATDTATGGAIGFDAEALAMAPLAYETLMASDLPRTEGFWMTIAALEVVLGMK